jgi:hypothetical protein
MSFARVGVIANKANCAFVAAPTWVTANRPTTFVSSWSRRRSGSIASSGPSTTILRVRSRGSHL